MIFSDMGGIDIEQVAEEHPDHVAKLHFSTLVPFTDYRAKQLVASLGIKGGELTSHHQHRDAAGDGVPRL